MSLCTSPAIASPPTTATATGRNSGSTMPERGEREQRAVGEHGGEERRAGAGPRAEVGQREQHRDQGRQRVERGDGHPRARPPQQLDQLDPDHGVVASRTTCSRVRRTGSSPVTRTPAATSRALRSAASSAVTTTSRGAALLDPAVEERDGRADVGGLHADQPGDRADRGHVLLQHQTSAVEHADPGGHLLDLGEQVAGQEDRGAVAVQPEQQLADVADALRVEAVGRLVEHEQRWSSHQGGGEPEPLLHAERVGLRRTLVARDRARPARAPRRCGPGERRGVRADRPRRRRGRGWRDRTGAGRRPVPRPARRPGGAPTPTTSASAHRRARPRRRWPSPARAASARSWSCRSRWRRGSRRRRPRGRRGRTASTARTSP